MPTYSGRVDTRWQRFIRSEPSWENEASRTENGLYGTFYETAGSVLVDGQPYFTLQRLGYSHRSHLGR
jgi:hypothetical protein